MGIEVLQGFAVRKARGKSRITGIEISKVEMQAKPPHWKSEWRMSKDVQILSCDLLATSGGFNPVVHLDCHCGGKTYFDNNSQSFLPQKERKNRQVCGAVNSIGFWKDAIIDAKNKAQLTLYSLNENSQINPQNLSNKSLNYFNIDPVSYTHLTLPTN